MLATKIRIVRRGAHSGRPSACDSRRKLPNASNENGLGTDITDFYASLLVGKTVQSMRVVGNVGVAILGDPTSAVPAQNDLMTFGVSVARAMTTAAEIVAEVNGRLNFANGDPDPGAENRAAMRLGASLHARPGAARCRRHSRDDVARSDVRRHGRLHLGLQRLPCPVMRQLAARQGARLRQRFPVHSARSGRRICDPAALARASCARHTGIGGDGLILYTVAPDGSARMTLFNADGSPSELSGNGLRCLAALVRPPAFAR